MDFIPDGVNENGGFFIFSLIPNPIEFGTTMFSYFKYQIYIFKLRICFYEKGTFDNSP